MATDIDFMRGQLAGLTTSRELRLVSEWAASSRYMPKELTTKPGNWDNEYTAYMVEIMDRLSASSDARKVAVMKGAQIGATTALLENAIGYWIDHDPGGILYVSADAELTRMGMTMKIDRMLHYSGLSHLLGAPDASTKRSGDTSTLKEFPNGFLLGVGARNPGKLRQVSAKYALLDELDGMPSSVGNIGKEEGSPVDLIEKRTDSYSLTRKILYLSTPLKMQTSMIYPLYMSGDQRHYYVPCIHCGEFQVLVWHGVSEKYKHAFGMQFDLDNSGKLIKESVGYACEYCAVLFYNHDKAWFTPQGEWRPHAETSEEGLYSYHIPAFLSPPGMYPWSGIVQKWLKAWDVKNDRVRDIDKYATFVNLEQGLPWEERGESPSFERVRQHRRQTFSRGEINNELITRETGAPAMLVTASADVHKNRIDTEVVAWCQGRQSYSLEWLHIEGDTEDLTSPDSPWLGMRYLLEQCQWEASDGRQYRIATTLIDAGYRPDAVYQFCKEYSAGVFPCLGRQDPAKGHHIKEFQQSVSATGELLYNVTTSLYKDRLAGWLRMDWVDGRRQPDGYPNFPADRPDDFFREYEAEEKVEVLDRITRRRKGMEWRQKGQRPNHAWDCRVYAMCAYDMVAHTACTEDLKLTKIDYSAFAKFATPRRNTSGLWLPSPYSYHPEQVTA